MGVFADWNTLPFAPNPSGTLRPLRSVEASEQIGILMQRLFIATVVWVLLARGVRAAGPAYTIQQVGLTGTNYQYTLSGGETYRYGQVQQLNAAGQVAGITARYNASGTYLGQDAWLSTGSTTQIVGLTGSGYEYTSTGTGGGTYRAAQAQLLNAAGQVAGFSYRYNASGTGLGRDAWLSTGSTTQLVGLTGTGYEYASTGTGGGTVRYGQAQQLNAAGQVAGYATRYVATGGSPGQDGWFYDDDTNVTTPLRFSVSSTGLSSTSPAILTDAGAVLGSYELYSGSTDQGSRAFAWTLSGGFYDLGGLVNGGLTAAGWQKLADAFAAVGTTADGSPQYVVGNGLVADGNTGNDVYLLTTAAPEPTSLLLVAMAATPLAVGRRHRRINRRSVPAPARPGPRG